MEKPDIKANTDKLIHFVALKFESGELDNNSLLELFKVMGCYSPHCGNTLLPAVAVRLPKC